MQHYPPDNTQAWLEPQYKGKPRGGATLYRRISQRQNGDLQSESSNDKPTRECEISTATFLYRLSHYDVTLFYCIYTLIIDDHIEKIKQQSRSLVDAVMSK